MSTDYFLACLKCKKITPVASDSSLSGWKWFCTPDKGPVWFIGHHADHLDAMRVIREQGAEWDDFDHVEPSDPDTSNLPERPRITISGDGVVTSTAADVINTKIGRAQLEALDELIRQGLLGGEERPVNSREENNET